MSFSLRSWTLVAVALVAGCGKTPAPPQFCPVPTFAALMEAADPPPADLINAVLTGAEAEEVPPPPGKGDEYLEAVGQSLAGAAEKPEQTASAEHLVFMYTTRSCTNCPAAKRVVVPELQKRGYAVMIVPIDHWKPEQWEASHISGVPAFVFMRRDSPGSKNVTQEPDPVIGGMDNNHRFDASQFADAFAKYPPKSQAVGAFGLFEIPPIRLSDWIPLIAGGEKSLGWGVSVNVPQNLTWTIRKQGQSLFLDFKPGSCPQVSWPMRTVNFQSVEINPAYIEVKTNAWLPVLRTIRLNIDYTPPGAPAPKQAAPQAADERRVA